MIICNKFILKREFIKFININEKYLNINIHLTDGKIYTVEYDNTLKMFRDYVNMCKQINSK